MKKILLLFAAIALYSCSKGKETKNVERAFYYWKSDEWNFQDAELNLLDSVGAHKLYVKFFEVEKNSVAGNIPISKTNLRSSHYSGNDSLLIIPTIYLHNDVFSKVSKSSIDTLVNNVNYLIGKYSANFEEGAWPINEYQMDCDWTLSTRDNYFYFLKKIKEASGKKISCTLRLYPYKYHEKMGVPPVDSAMLMCYNLVNPMESHDKNSILDLEELSSYLGNYKYPLHLDIALPLYSWAHVYQNNQFAQVIYYDMNELKKSLTPQRRLWYEANEDIMVNDFYLRKGDKVKIEEMEPDYVTKAIAIIKNKVPLDESITVSFFHLDYVQLSTYTNEQIGSFYTGFTRQ